MVVAPKAGQSQTGGSTFGPIKRTKAPLWQAWTLHFLAERQYVGYLVRSGPLALSHTACAQHQPTPPYASTCVAHTRTHQWAQYTPAYINERRQINPKESGRGRTHRRRNDTRRGHSASPCGQSRQCKQSHDGHQSCRVSNQDAATCHGSSAWTANRGAILQLQVVSMMQGCRSPTGVSKARRARLPRPLAGTRGCHPP